MGVNLKRLSRDLDVTPLLLAVLRQPKLWTRVTLRQDTPGSAHYETESIPLFWPPGETVESLFKDLRALKTPELALLPEALPLITRVFAEVGGQDLGRVVVVGLHPFGAIDPHIDEGPYADHYERFHVPLESEDCTFSVEQGQGVVEVCRMAPGELWWFNHKRLHWVRNYSVTPRLHLIIDTVAPRFRREREPDAALVTSEGRP